MDDEIVSPEGDFALPYSRPNNWLGNLHWRTGKEAGRTIYAQIGPFPHEDDPIIGMMDSRDLASAAVYGHNLHLRILERGAARRGDPT